VQLLHIPQEPQRTADVQRSARKLLPVVGKPKVAGVDAWRARTIATNDTCLSCKYAFYCGGGCAAEAWTTC
jgi:radical SAM protein with 4Fe4S-binding SPASM domain